MQYAANFVDWNIDTTGGQAATWRMYEGFTSPMLKAFMTKATVSANDKTTTYNGQPQVTTTSSITLADGSAVDSGKVQGTASFACTQNGGCTNAGTYSLIYSGGLYSGQQGYDFVASTTAGTLLINDSLNSSLPAQLLQSAQQGGTSTVVKTVQVGETFQLSSAQSAKAEPSAAASETFQLSSAEGALEAELVNIGEQFAFKVKQKGVNLPAVLKP